MDPTTLLFVLEVREGINVHFNMGLPLGVPSLSPDCLLWPMLAFATPHSARSLIERAWDDFYDHPILSEIPEDIGVDDDVDDLPALVDEDGVDVVPDGDTIKYPWPIADHL